MNTCMHTALAAVVLGVVVTGSAQQRQRPNPPTLSLQVGDPAPAFEASTYDAQPVRLAAFQGKKNVVLYFYPKDDTPGCTREACSFRDNLQSLTDADTEILGVSVDDVESHEAFRDKYNLNFSLVADPQQEIVGKYGVAREARGTVLAHRVTFLIDKQGIIRHIWNPVSPDGHAEEVLARIKELGLQKKS